MLENGQIPQLPDGDMGIAARGGDNALPSEGELRPSPRRFTPSGPGQLPRSGDPSGPPDSYDLPHGDAVSLLEVVNVLLRRWRLAVGIPLTTAFVTAVVTLLVRPTYTATVAFVPETKSGTRLAAGAASLAGQLGLSLGTEASQSPRFYTEVAKSREFMESVLLATYPRPRSPDNIARDSASLLDLLNVTGENQARRLANAVRKLQSAVWTTVDNQTSIVRLSVDADDPVLAASVANRFVGNLNRFNLERRQSQARQRRRFIDGRLAEAEQDLHAGEDRLRSFLERNRQFESSPELQFEHGRLQRQVAIRQEVYLTLKREDEIARIEEVNDTPVITVIDSAVPPQQKSKPKRKLLVIFALAIGSALAVLGAFSAEYLERIRYGNGEHYKQFTALVQRVKGEIRQLVGLRKRR